jgi:hypothetical protein
VYLLIKAVSVSGLLRAHQVDLVSRFITCSPSCLGEQGVCICNPLRKVTSLYVFVYVVCSLRPNCVRVIIAFEFFYYFKPTLRGGLRFLKFQKRLKKNLKGTVEQVSKTISKVLQIPFIIAA